MNSIKDAHELRKETREPKWGLKEKNFGRSADNPRRCATLISNWEKFTSSKL